MNDASALDVTFSSSDPVMTRTISRRSIVRPDGVIFRTRRPEDSVDLFDLFNEQTFLDNASTHGPFDMLEDFEDWLDGIAPAGKHEIVAEVGSKVVAFGGLYAFPELMSHCGSLVLGVREDWQKRNIGTTILDMLLVSAEVMAGLNKIHLTVFSHNIAAIRLYSHFGFEVEGLLKRFVRRGDSYTDAYSMALFFDKLNAQRRVA